MEEPTTQKRPARRKRNSIFFPLLLLCLGIVLLLHTMNILPDSAWGTIVVYWPVLFIAGALDSIYRGEGYVGAVIWGGLGVFLLLSNLGMMSNASWTVLLRWWPVLLIAGGLDLIIGRHSIWSAIIGLVLGAALLTGVVWLSMGMSPTANIETYELQYELDEAETVYANLSATAGELTIKGGAEPGNAAEAVISKSANEEISDDYYVQGDRGYFDLENDGLFILYPAFQSASAKSVWDVYFNEDTTLVLESQLVAGDQRFNLNKLNVKRFNVRTIFGRATVVMPRQGDFVGDAGVIFGELMVFVPEDAAVCIYTDTGLTSLDLPDGFIREDDYILSPNADPNESCVELTAAQAIGTLRVAEY
jgi:LiaI-LiaF-like transmembrane region